MLERSLQYTGFRSISVRSLIKFESLFKLTSPPWPPF